MKQVFVSVLLLLTGLSSFAGPLSAGDQDIVLFTCESAEPYPDKVIKLTVVEGGYTGMTRMKMEESLVWGTRSRSYVVTMEESSGSTLVYKSALASLTIQMNDKDENGMHPAYFIRHKATSTQTEALKCLGGR